jgi:hypothetical protein
MATSTTLISKKRGPKPKGATGIMVRVPPESLARIDSWIDRQGKPSLSRPEAIRRLTERALDADPEV